MRATRPTSPLLRLVGAALMLVGAAAGALMVFGPPHYWSGLSSAARLALKAAEVAAVTGGAWLLAGGGLRRERHAEDAPDEPSAP